MQISEIRNKSDEAILEEIRSLEQTRLDITMRAVTEEGEGHKLRNIRRDIARYKTVLSERQRQEA